MKPREINRKIEALGGEYVRQKGSHRSYRVVANGVVGRTIVPQHTGDMPPGLLRTIERDLEEVLGKGWLR